MKLTGYVHHLLVAVDQLANTLLDGWPDETLSSRAFRWKRDGVRQWPCRVIDRLFFWDTMQRGGQNIRHCQLSYESERYRMQQPPELR